MKKFQDYIAETEEWINTPAQGDEIDFELAPDSLLETYVVETVEDGVIIEADERALALLEQHGVLLETIRTYGAVGRAGTGQTYYEADASEDVDSQHDKEKLAFDRLQKLAGLSIEEDQAADVVAAKEFDIDMTNPMPGVHEAHEIPGKDEYYTLRNNIWTVYDGDEIVMEYEPERGEVVGAKKLLARLDDEGYDVTHVVSPMGFATYLYGKPEDEIDEADYHGRDVPLGKPMQGDVKKFKVYVRDPQTGNVKKVNFGDKTMRIKKSNPARRKSFRARHRCSNPGPRTKARYWSCRKW